MQKQQENGILQMQNFFDADQFAKFVGMQMECVDKEKAVVGVDITNDHANGHSFVQGGMLYALADFAFALLANYLHPVTVTQCGHINYLRPASGKHLRATARETAVAGRTCLTEVRIENEANELLCVCNFNGFIKGQ